MHNRIALALLPLALFSMAAKGNGCGTEEPIVAADAAAPDGSTGDCPIPEPSCPTGSSYSVASCACVTTTPPADASSPDTSTGIGDCPIPEPSCPTGTQYSVADCSCVGVPDGSTSPPTCSELSSSAQNAIIAAETQAQADLKCTAAADCVVANNATACVDGCGIVLSQASAVQFEAAVTQVNATTCATYTADGCPPVTALPCAAAMAFCTHGECSSSP